MQALIYWTLSNPAFILYILALLAIVIRLWGRQEVHDSKPRVDIALAYMLLIPVGFNGLYNFVMHAFFGNTLAAFIGWPQSPFQVEVAIANLSFGLLGCLCFRADYGFRLATVIGVSVFLLGAAANHVFNYLMQMNAMPGNVGTVLFTDILIPVTLLILTLRYRSIMHAHALHKDHYID